MKFFLNFLILFLLTVCTAQAQISDVTFDGTGARNYRGYWELTKAYKLDDIVVHQNKFYRANSAITTGTFFLEGTAASEWTEISAGGGVGFYRGPWALANVYAAGEAVSNSGRIYEANSAIAANTAFVIGTAVNEWTELSEGDSTFKGPWVLADAYATGDVVIESDKLYRANSAIAANTAFVIGNAANEWTEVSAGAGQELIKNILVFAGNTATLVDGNWEIADASSGGTALDDVIIPAYSAVGDKGRFYNHTTLTFDIAKDAGDSFVVDAGVLRSFPETGFDWEFTAPNEITIEWHNYSFATADMQTTGGRSHTANSNFSIVGSGSKTFSRNLGSESNQLILSTGRDTTLRSTSSAGENVFAGHYSQATADNADSKIYAENATDATEVHFDARTTDTGSELRIRTPNIAAGTATVGQVPRLQDATTGEIEYGEVLAAVRIDSSAAATTETLGVSTNSGGVKLFTNIDLTNTATLAVQSGETLNGITDGSFLFSNYPEGSQFRADEVTGGWVVSVVGASNQTNLYYVSLATSTGTVTGGLVNGLNLSGVFHLPLDDLDFTHVFDKEGLIIDDPVGGDHILVPVDGTYEVTFHAVPWTFAEHTTAIRVDGNIVADALGLRTSASGSFGQRSASFIGELTAGQKVSFTSSFSIFSKPTITFKQLPSIESVIAGHVVVEDLDWITVVNEINNKASVLDSGQNKLEFEAVFDQKAGGSLALADGKITLDAGKTYEITYVARSQQQEGWQVYDFTNGTPLSPLMTGGSISSHGGASKAIVTPIADIEVGLVSLDTHNTGYSPANGGSSMTVREIASQSVIMPGAIVPETLANFVFSEGTNQTEVDNEDVVIGTGESLSGGITLAANVFTLPQSDIPYELEAFIGLDVDQDPNEGISVFWSDASNTGIGTNITNAQTSDGPASTLNRYAGRASAVVDASAGDVQVKLRVANNTTDGTNHYNIINVGGSIRQSPTQSVVSNSAAQAAVDLHFVSLNAWSAVLFDNTTGYLDMTSPNLSGAAGTIYDPEGLINTGTDRINITQDGTYKVTFSGASSISTWMYIRKNGATVPGVAGRTGQVNGSSTSVEVILDLIAGDFIQPNVENGTDLTIMSFTVQQLK